MKTHRLKTHTLYPHTGKPGLLDDPERSFPCPSSIGGNSSATPPFEIMNRSIKPIPFMIHQWLFSPGHVQSWQDQYAEATAANK